MMTNQISDLCEKYVFWAHDSTNKDWSLNSFKRIHEFNSVNDFWSIFNFFNKLNHKLFRYYLMNHLTAPVISDVNNINGGSLSIRIETIKDNNRRNGGIDNNEQTKRMWSKAYELLLFLACNLVTNELCTNTDDINGISFNPKGNKIDIKIWNKLYNPLFKDTLKDNIILELSKDKYNLIYQKNEDIITN